MNKETVEAYRQKLLERQRQEGWSDREMDRQLRMSTAYWTRVRLGQHDIGGRGLLHIMARFPEYNDLARFLLSADAAVGSKSAAEESDDGRAA